MVDFAPPLPPPTPSLAPSPPPATDATSPTAPTPSSRPNAFTISPLTEADLDTVLEIHHRAFSAEHIHCAFFNHLDYLSSVRPSNEAYFRKRIAKNAARTDGVGAGGKAAVKISDGEGQVVGFAVWILPKVDGVTEEAEDDELSGWPEGCDLEAVNAYFGRFDTGIKEPHWYLSNLGIDPPHQGKGAGRALCEWGTAQADAAGVPAYLVASLEGIQPYLKCGFVRHLPPIVGEHNGLPLSAQPMRRLPPATATPAPVPFTRELAPVTVEFLRPEDFAAAGAMMSAAWLTDSMCHWIYQDVTRPELDATHVSFLETLPRDTKIVVAKRGDQLAGFTKWEYPVFPGDPPVEHPPRAYPKGARFEEVTAFRETYKNTKLDDGPKFILSGLAVHPDFRRQGVAQAMLEFGCAEVDRAGLPCFLFSSSMAVRGYEKAGFAVTGPAYRGGPNNEWSSTPMRRAAQPLVVSPASAADAPAFGRINVRAFAHEAFNRQVFGSVTDETLAAHFASEHAEILGPGMGRVAFKAERGGVVIGFATLIAPVSLGDPARPWREDKWPAGSKPELVAEWFSRMDLKLTERHWYLEYLAVDPSSQRQGVGKALAEKAVALADAESLPVYLKSSKPAKPLYKSVGFTDFREPIAGGDEGQFVVVPMKREARSTGGGAGQVE